MRLISLLIVIVALAAAGACARAKARTAPEGPPLDMPAPPPRVIAPADEPLPAAPMAPESPAPPPRSAPRPSARENGRGTEPAQKVEPPPETPPVEVKPAEPPPALRPAPSATDGTAERRIRAALGEASRDLARVDYNRLTQDGRAQYEQAKRFMEQAEQALGDRNLVYARTLADKAAQLASVLLGR